jgi:transposase-like protein
VAGRPSKFRPEFVDQAAKLAQLGATDREIGDFFKVDERTINRWKHRAPRILSVPKGRQGHRR